MGHSPLGHFHFMPLLRTIQRSGREWLALMSSNPSLMTGVTLSSQLSQEYIINFLPDKAMAWLFRSSVSSAMKQGGYSTFLISQRICCEPPDLLSV